jgi:hypothetical protein
VLRLWLLLYRHRRATSCWIIYHASSSTYPKTLSSPRCPHLRAPRLPRASAGRHLLVTVESSPWSLNSLSLARNSTTLTSTSYSSRACVNSRALNHNPPPPFFSCSGNARHPRGQPPSGILRPNQPSCKLSHCSLVLVNPLLPSNCGRSFISDKRRRCRLRPHRGQHDPSIPTPPRLPSQHHIITPELYDHLVESLVPYIFLPMLAGIHPRRRRHCLRRLPLI